MNNFYLLIKTKSREIATAFLRGLDLRWVKKDWEENSVSILQCFFGWMLATALLLITFLLVAISAFIVIATLAATLAACVAAISLLSSVNVGDQAAERLKAIYPTDFTSIFHTPPFQPPRISN